MNSDTWAGIAPKLALLLCIALYSVTCIAATDVYTGKLVPESADRSIPITIEVKNAGGKLLGNVKTSSPLTSSPLTSTGEHVLGEKLGDECHVASSLGHGLTLGMTGVCTPTQYTGTYKVFVRDLQHHQGTFTLSRVKPDDGKKKLSESERHSLASATNTSCLRSNTTCLSVCPRGGDYNAEFLCANTCRHKLATCRARAKKRLDAAAPHPID